LKVGSSAPKSNPFYSSANAQGTTSGACGEPLSVPLVAFWDAAGSSRVFVSHPANRLFLFKLRDRDVRKVAVPNATRSKSTLEVAEALALYHA
jgi:hypothetical protein